MEQWGTGVQRVFEQLAEADLPEPKVEEVMGQLRSPSTCPRTPPKPSSTPPAIAKGTCRVSKV